MSKIKKDPGKGKEFHKKTKEILNEGLKPIILKKSSLNGDFEEFDINKIEDWTDYDMGITYLSDLLQLIMFQDRRYEFGFTNKDFGARTCTLVRYIYGEEEIDRELITGSLSEISTFIDGYYASIVLDNEDYEYSMKK